MKLGYARVSTIDQSLDLQLDALKAAGCDEIFSDHGISGNTFSRKGLNQILSTLKSGDLLIVWKLDRLGRSLRFLTKFIDSLKQQGIGFKSLTDGIDTTSTNGLLVFHIMASLAEFERSLISERTKEGMKAAKTRGVHVGRPKKISDKQIVQIKKSLNAGFTRVSIAKAMDVSINTNYRAIRS